jgi:hypothetical protein
MFGSATARELRPRPKNLNHEEHEAEQANIGYASLDPFVLSFVVQDFPILTS